MLLSCMRVQVIVPFWPLIIRGIKCVIIVIRSIQFAPSYSTCKTTDYSVHM